MPDQAFEIDPSLLHDFLAEGLESLDAIDPLFVELEARPDDTGIVDGIFRPVHSVKGNSGFFGLTNIKSFAHVMENILGEIRARKRKTTPHIIDLLLKGVDFLRGMLNRLAAGDYSRELTPEEEAHLALLNEASANAGGTDAPAAAGAADAGELSELAFALRSAFDEFKAAIDDQGMAVLEEAVNNIVNQIVPPKVKAQPDADNAAASWTLGGVDINGPMTDMRAFISNVGRDETEEARCEVFLKNLDGLEELAKQQGGHDALLAALATLRDEFVTLHQSGIGFDELMASLMLERLEAVEQNVDRLTIGSGSHGGGAGAEDDGGVLAIGAEEVTEVVAALRGFLANLAESQKDADAVAAFRAGEESLANLAKAHNRPELAAALELSRSDFDTLQESGIGFDSLMIELMGERLAAAVKLMDRPAPPADTIALPFAEADGPAAGDTQIMQTADLAAIAAAAAPGKDGKPAPAAPRGEGGGKTIRVAEEKVDQFMNFVGELIITGEVFAYIQKKLEAYPEARQVSTEFKNANIAFGELSSNLQKSLMEVRRVPLKSLMQRLPRIIRDTASQLGKHIDFTVIGEDVQIDKSLLEGLESPLVHMVRNSVDHGVEKPDERVAAGKPEKGKVVLEAKATEERFTLTIQDDGKGLDVDAIKSKAVSRGLLTEDAARAMPDKEAFRLVFSAGLSTAKVVTDVSGRGVGMDVVLSNITKMGGQISVDSVKGAGSTFTITLPMTVTLAVIDGLVARIGDEQFIVPLTDVLESVRPRREQLHTVQERGEVIDVRGELQPLVRLNDVLGIGGDTIGDPCDATVILVQGKRGVHGAFMVDEVLGQQSVVVKDLGKQFSNLASIQGGSILGNGRVGLVLDTNGILDMTGLQQAGE